ncbi:MAG: DUF3102 domain-containing protein [Clostridia bacterium]|nr:DUF3102 domain-containing protein [Clostridia bacterium]MBP3930839.1 DUF3102 domain-containing protein [Peptostreptococcaceae bacterium]
MKNVVIEQSIQQKSKVDELKESCKRAMDSTEENYVIMGERLSQLQEEMKKDGSNFMEWLEQDTRISYSTANRYIKVVQGYNTREEEARRKHVAALGIKKAYLLLKIKNIDERYSFIKENQIRYKSYEITKELLAEYLNINQSDEKKSSNNKDVSDKFKRIIDEEIKKYNETINSLDTDTRTIYHDIKDKLSELQKLLIKARNYDEEVPRKIDEN